MNTLPFDYRAAFRAFRNRDVQFLLVGGLNYFLAHKPVATQDIDLLVEDRPENLARTEMALVDIQAEWGRTDEDWGPVREKKSGWLSNQGIYCLLTRFGPVDIFRTIAGIASFEAARRNSVEFQFGTDESVRLINIDMDMAEFESEHLKRERRISNEQRRAWADGLLESLPLSAAYQRKCTPEARLKEQVELNANLHEWLQRQNAEGK